MPREGWICPRCRMAHAPWVPSCDCHTRSSGINVTLGGPIYDRSAVPYAYDTSEPRTAKRPCPTCKGTGTTGQMQVRPACRGAKEI